jgi:hypothetical protein
MCSLFEREKIMNRFASLIAFVGVVAIVSAMSASFTGTSLAVVTVLVASGVLVYRVASTFESAKSGATSPGNGWHFAGNLIRQFLRFAVGAIVIAWMVVSLLWWVVG